MMDALGNIIFFPRILYFSLPGATDVGVCKPQDQKPRGLQGKSSDRACDDVVLELYGKSISPFEDT